MALTLLEAKKLVTDPLTVAVIDEFAEGDIIRRVPFQNITGTGVHYNRAETLPGVAFRGVNEAYTESAGVLNPQSESLKLFGGDLDCDRYLVDTMGPTARQAHERLKIKSLRLSWEYNFIKGDSDADPRGFDGLQKRIIGDQRISNNDSGGALSLTKLDQLISQVEGTNKALIMHYKMRDLLTAASRNTGVGGFLTYDTDEFGKKVTQYAGLPILVDNPSNPILGFTEALLSGSGSTFSSIYCVDFSDLGTTGIQGAVNGRYGISVRDMGEIETAPVFRTRVDWYCSIAIFNGYSAARLANISNATPVA